MDFETKLLDTISKVKAIIGNSKKVAVHLDSNHTHDHVLSELNNYAPLVGLGQYLICGDTIIEDIPNQDHRPRPWGKGNNPQTALNEYLLQDNALNKFKLDQKLASKLLISNQKNGYLLRIN